MLKIYETRGVVECLPVFRLGGLSVRCHFSGGSVNESGMIPAVYSTNDPVKQAIIENSELFKSGRFAIQSEIKEVSDYEAEEAAKREAEEKKVISEQGGSINEGGIDYPEVTNSQAAKAILMSEPYKVPLVELQNKEAVKVRAAELGVTFSNWN